MKEVQEKLLPGELAVSPRIFPLIFPQEWGIQGVDLSPTCMVGTDHTTSRCRRVSFLSTRPTTVHSAHRGVQRGFATLRFFVYPNPGGSRGLNMVQRNAAGSLRVSLSNSFLPSPKIGGQGVEAPHPGDQI